MRSVRLHPRLCLRRRGEGLRLRPLVQLRRRLRLRELNAARRSATPGPRPAERSARRAAPEGIDMTEHSPVPGRDPAAVRTTLPDFRFTGGYRS